MFWVISCFMMCARWAAAESTETKFRHLWSQSFGSVNDFFSAVAIDASGRVALAGRLYGTTDFGGGPVTGNGGGDLVVACFDENGTHLWSKSFEGDGSQNALDLAFDPAGDLVITGYLFGSADFGGGPLVSAGADDILLLKLDPDGHHVWSKIFGGGNGFPNFQRGESLAIDSHGNISLTGSLGGPVDFGGGSVSGAAYLAKFDADGNHLWSKGFGGPTGDLFREKLASDGTGNVVLTASLRGSIDFGGGTRTSAGNFDVIVAKFDRNGDHLWSHRFGDASSQDPFDIATDDEGNIIVGGLFGGTMDFGGGSIVGSTYDETFLFKLDPNGLHLWSQHFTGSQRLYAVEQWLTLDVDRRNRIVMAGAFDGERDFGGGPLLGPENLTNVFVARFDADGTHLQSQQFGDSNLQWNVDNAVDPAGNVIVMGSFNFGVDFGGGQLTSSDFRAFYLAKLGVSPTVTLRVNGQDPPDDVAVTQGRRVQVTLDVDPGTETRALDWYYGISFRRRVFWFTENGLRWRAAPLARLAPVLLNARPIFDRRLRRGSSTTFFFLLVDGSEIVAFDSIVASVPSEPGR